MRAAYASEPVHHYGHSVTQQMERKAALIEAESPVPELVAALQEMVDGANNQFVTAAIPFCSEWARRIEQAEAALHRAKE